VMPHTTLQLFGKGGYNALAVQDAIDAAGGVVGEQFGVYRRRPWRGARCCQDGADDGKWERLTL
jgi:hypothetical protein